MDLDAEMAKLSAEARKKLDAERPEPLPTERPRPKAAPDAEVDKEVQRLTDEAEKGGPPLSMGAKIAIVVGALIALNVAWVYVIKPLVGLAILVGAVALIVLGVMKL